MTLAHRVVAGLLAVPAMLVPVGHAGGATAEVSGGVLSVRDAPGEQGTFTVGTDGVRYEILAVRSNGPGAAPFSRLDPGPGCFAVPPGPYEANPSPFFRVACPAAGVGSIRIALSGGSPAGSLHATYGGVSLSNFYGPTRPIPVPVIVDGGPSADRIDLAQAAAPVRITGDGGDDQLIGGAARDVIDGGPGDDEVNGLDGDTLIGGDGSDSFGYDQLKVKGLSIDCGPGRDVLEPPGLLPPGNTLSSSCPPALLAGNGLTARVGRNQATVALRITRPARASAVIIGSPTASRGIAGSAIRPAKGTAFTLRIPLTAKQRKRLLARSRWFIGIALDAPNGEGTRAPVPLRLRRG